MVSQFFSSKKEENIFQHKVCARRMTSQQNK